MSQPEKTYLLTDECKVTDRQVTVGKRSFEISQIKGIRSIAEPSYRSRAIPFFLALVFVVLTLSELVNDPDDYTLAVIAGVFAIASMLVLRLMGTLKTHTVWLSTTTGEVMIYRSILSSAAASLVEATQQAMSRSESPVASTWGVGKRANG
jgi:hypothetical protein